MCATWGARLPARRICGFAIVSRAIIPLVFLFQAAAWAAPLTSQVSEVTVYADRARVSRTVDVDLAAGDSQVEIADLPASLEQNSVEISGQGSAQVTIRGVDLRQNLRSDSPSQAVRDLEQQLKEKLDQKAKLESDKGLLNDKRTFLLRLTSSLGGEKQPLGADQVRDLYTFFSTELSSVATQLLALDQNLQTIAPEIDRIKRELDRLRKDKSTGAVVVALNASAATKFHLVIRYVVPNASWRPVYDARVQTDTGAVELAYNAMVRQTTGEDWSNVKLILSTAQPGRNGEMPELQPDFLNFSAPPAPVPLATSAGQFRNMMKAPVQDVTESTPTAEVESKTETAAVRLSGLAVAFVVPVNATIPADGQTHKVAVTQLSLNGKLTYITTPKLDAAAFVVAKVKNDSDSPFIAGELNLFRDGDLVGHLNLPEVPSGSPFDLFCGTDDAIKITRKELVNRTSQTGLIINQRAQVNRKYQITIENFRTKPIQITVLDQLPVSQNGDINVKAVNFSVQPSAQGKDTGKLTWDLTVQPKEKKVVEFEYQVDWPSGKEVTLD
jgi:uncharacterized protein (TIGR02231 family)